MFFFKLFIFSIYIFSAYCLLPNDRASFRKNNDCKKLYNFFRDYGKINVPGCCNTTDQFHFIRCENDHVVDITLRPQTDEKTVDFRNFPILEELENLVVEGIPLNNSIMPARLFELPKLKAIEISSSDLHEIEEIESCHVESLNFYETELNEFPKEILKCPDLNFLDLTLNTNITSIPKEISNLQKLKQLYLGVTGITELPKEINKLKVKDFDLNNIENLSIEFHNFTEPIDICDFRNITIKCYDKGACNNFVIQENPERVYIKEDYRYPECEYPKPAIKKESTYITTCIIISVVVVAVLANIIIFCCCQRNNKKNRKEINEEEDENNSRLSPFPRNKTFSEDSTLESSLILSGSKASHSQNSYSHGSTRARSPVIENKGPFMAPTLVSESYTAAPTDMNVMLHRSRDAPAIDINNSFSTLPSEISNSHIIVGGSIHNTIPIGNANYISPNRYNNYNDKRSPNMSKSSINNSKSSIQNSSNTFVSGSPPKYGNKLYQVNNGNQYIISNSVSKANGNNFSQIFDSSDTYYNESSH